MKHKHYECIVAWAEGKTVQFRCKNFEWQDCVATPSWREDWDYRIKSHITTLVINIDKACTIHGISVHTPSYHQVIAGSKGANLELVFENEKLVAATVLEDQKF